MATLANLIEDGELIKIEIDLDRGVLPWRVLYGTPDFIGWLSDVLPYLETDVIGGEITPFEQVDAVFNEYVSGVPMDADRRFKKLSHTPDYFVWEFKTIEIRLFGWIPQPDHFILTFGDLKDEIMLKQTYTQYILKTEFVRNKLDLDNPKSIESKEYFDVLSNAD